MDLRAYIESNHGAFLRVLYGLKAPDWRRLMQEMPEDDDLRKRYFDSVCTRICRKIKWDKCPIDDEKDLDAFERILDVMQKRAWAFGNRAIEDVTGEVATDPNEFLALNLVARKGWTRVIDAFASGVGSGVETVDVHSVKTAILATLMDIESSERLFLMGLVHDHAEQWIGDLTPSEVADRKEKKRRELSVYREKIETSGLSEKKKSLFWGAFEQCMRDDSMESCLIHMADKIDMAMQAWVYESEYKVQLQEFFDSAAMDIERALDKMMTLKKICDT